MNHPPYPTIKIDSRLFELAQSKAEELVKHFKPKVVERQRSGSQIQGVEERLLRMKEDQLTGQLAQLAGTVYMTGSDQMYRIQRWNCMQTPDRGDGGYDIPGLCLDWKGSRLRPGLQPTSYVLPVRPRERKPDWTYCLVVVDARQSMAYCHIMGWVSDKELEGKLQTSGLFNGAHVVGYSELHPLPKLTWEL
jgi:hypothetical protein